MNEIFAPENFVKEAWYFALETEYLYFQALNAHDYRWYYTAKHFKALLNKDYMFHQPVFILKPSADIPLFERKANTILRQHDFNGHYKIKIK